MAGRTRSETLAHSFQLKEGDEVDVIKGICPKNPNNVVVSRVEVLSMKVRDEQIVIIAKRHKTYTIENYPGADAFKGDVAQ